MKIIFVISVFYLLLSCHSNNKKWSSDDLIISEYESLTYPRGLTSSEVEEDISFLLFTLDNAYGGKEYLAVEQLAKSLSVIKKISRPQSVKDFHEQLDNALFLIPDNHLHAFYKSNFGSKRAEFYKEKLGKVGKNAISDPKKILGNKS
jgi:hypothetical protein